MGQASCQEIVKGQDVPVPKAPPASGGSSACPRSPRSMAAKARSSAPVCNDTKDQMVTRVTANSGSNGNTGRRPSCLDPLPGAEPQTPAIESPRLKCPTSPRGLPGAASRVHGASDMELPAVAKMRTELAAKQKALQSLRQEGAQHKQLMEVLEQEAFQKDEDLRGLRVGEAARREAVALIAELRRKDADIDHLRKKVESEEGMLRALVVEAQTKGDAVEDLVTAITEQSMLQTGGPKLQALNKKLGAGTRICVLGGTKFNDVDTEAIVKAVAKELSASLGHSAVFITGGMPGVQETFAKHCVAESRLFNLLPDGQQSNYGVGEDIHAGSNLDERIQVYGQLGHVYISFEGGPGVSKEAKAAVARSAGVVPLIRTGGASGGMFDFPAGALKKPPFATDEQWNLLGSQSSSVAESAGAVVQIVKGFIAQGSVPRRSISKPAVSESFAVVAQWNLAGVNTNALEFSIDEASVAPQDRPAARFVARLDATVGSIAARRPDALAASRLASMNSAELLAPFQEWASSSPLAAQLPAAAPLSSIGEMLVECLGGDRSLPRADLELARREFSLMRLTESNTPQLLQVCALRDEHERRREFCKHWLRSVEKAYPDRTSEKEFMEKAACIAAWDALLFEAAAGLLIEEDNLEELVPALSRLVACIGVEEDAKSARVVSTIAGVVRCCSPDLFAFQEFNQGWLKNPSFANEWRRLLDDYECIWPSHIQKPSQVTVLLVRRGQGTFVLDSEATTRALETVSRSSFVEERLRPAFLKIFGEAGMATVETLLEESRGPHGFLATKLAFGVCQSGGGRRLLVAAAHASSDGTNNRALVSAARCLADIEDCDLVLALDANSVAKVDEKAAAQGAAGQREFVEFMEKEGIKHCFSNLEKAAVSDPERFHTVLKRRTHLQCQLYKVGKVDRSAKDFIVAAGSSVHPAAGIRINTTAWMDEKGARSNAGANAGYVMPSEGDTWAGNLAMPTPDFASDHALVLAKLCLGSPQNLDSPRRSPQNLGSPQKQKAFMAQ
eukprot:gnl/TRDRNA2_/TRDRNA2_177506_c0_seq11.p1 gnl/TRDRNA2_/TRDRNA2_177506_c0~~gnl/TRDRNA2_/TRDRNA2_177506_c0_seq11.p1  ORF type:complete len:1037 (-),score=224.25 gnl/TRDRNA2_/TRDRNA2_177506_c0_seq11:135-3185(-)